MMDSARRDEVVALLMAMPKQFRELWCSSEACACMGCANRMGGLAKAGVSKAEWAEALDHIQGHR